METSVITPVQEQEAPEKDTGWSGGGPGGDESGGGGDGNGWNSGGAAPADVTLTGVWVAILAIIMFFAALTSVWVVLKGTTSYWTPTELPPIIYLNSVLLLASSLTLEFSRGSLSAGLPRRFLLWLYLTLALGALFIAGQLVAWRELISRGIYLSTDPSSSFFYLLTAAHGLHLLGGIAALLAVVFQGRKIASGFRRRELLDATAVYWHFMYGLWIYILLLLV
ncbi:MAG: cytochrome c oxidase subunit 3, partial [Terriglobia bacterium]